MLKPNFNSGLNYLACCLYGDKVFVDIHITRKPNVNINKSDEYAGIMNPNKQETNAGHNDATPTIFNIS